MIMDILIGIGQGLILVLWLWSSSKLFSNVILFKEDYLYIEEKDATSLDRTHLKLVDKYRYNFSKDLNKEDNESYTELVIFLNIPFTNWNLYVSRIHIISKSSNMIKIENLENFINSKKTINKYNL